MRDAQPGAFDSAYGRYRKRASLPVSPRWRTRGFSDYWYLRNTFLPIEVQMPFLSFVRKVGSI